MKLLLFLCPLICNCLVVKSQDFNEFTAIDQKVNRIPKSETYSSAAIAAYVGANFTTDREKIRAIYSWVISNLKYDTDSMYHINWSMYNDEKISATLRRKKGVCENYAALFTDIALKAGFQSFKVSGYTRESGMINRAGHSWSAVNLQGEWFLCDPTWDKDARNNTRYFLVVPGQFIETHMPFDPLWQLLEYPVTEKEFQHGYAKKDHHHYNFKDSVNAFLQQDSLQQLESAMNRIKQVGIEDERVKNWLAYNKMKVAIVYGEKDMDLYNSAVADLNKANAVFNDFVKYRNNSFIPSRPDAEINSLLDPIAGLLSGAMKNLDQLGQAVENFQYDTGAIKGSITNLSLRVKEQQVFLKRYLASSVADRGKLFYK